MRAYILYIVSTAATCTVAVVFGGADGGARTTVATYIHSKFGVFRFASQV